jgi:NADH:ubiquinone oxidoreductase subunit E
MFNSFKQNFNGNPQQELINRIKQNPQSRQQIIQLINNGQLQKMGVTNNEIQEIKNTISNIR